MKIGELIGKSGRTSRKVGYSKYIPLPLPDEGSLLSHGIALRRTSERRTFGIFRPYQISYVRQDLVNVGLIHPEHRFSETLILQDGEFMTPKGVEKIATRHAREMVPGLAVALQTAA